MLESVKFMFFFKILLLAYIIQTMYIAIITKEFEGSSKTINFMNLDSGVLVLRNGLISQIVKMHYFYKDIFLSTPGHGSDTLNML